MISKLKIIVIILLLSFFVNAEMCLEDNFNRADDTLRSPWVVPDWSGAGVQTVDSQAYSSNGHSIYDQTVTDSQFCWVILKNTNIGGLWVRAQTDTLQGYRLAMVPSTTMRLSRWDGGETILDDSAISYSPDDTLKIYPLGDTLYCYINGILYIKIQDATFSSGKVGIYSQGGILDNFVGGSYECTRASDFPTIDSVRNNPWYYGKVVSFYGSNFLSSQGTGVVLLVDTSLGPAVSWNDTIINDTIPTDMYRGKKLVRVVNDDGDTGVATDSLRVLVPYWGW